MPGRIPSSVIEEVRNRTDLAELISSYGIALRRAGSDYKACCPFHHEKTPSFVIHPDRGFYHCFGCGESGSAIEFVMKQEGLSFPEAVKKLAAQCGVTVEEQEDPEAGLRTRLYALHAELAAFFRRCLKVAPEAEPARQYLASRRLSEEAAESFMIGYAPIAPEALQKWAAKYRYTADEMDAAGVLLKSKYANGRPYNRFGGRLMFVICDREGRPVGFSGRILTNDKKAAKYVNSPETAIFKKSRVLFGFHKASRNILKDPNREAIVCEGQIDLIRCHSCGFPNAVASQGTAFTAEQVQMLKRVADRVTLVFDADGAGQKAAVRSGGMLLAAEIPVHVATLPPDEDPDSLLRDQGAEAFRACLDNYESITHFQIRTALAKEAHPESIDAVSRVSRLALETIAMSPSAVLRSQLMAEAAKLLDVPLAALEEDYAKVKSGVASRMRTAPAPAARAAREPYRAGASTVGTDAARAAREPYRAGASTVGTDAARAMGSEAGRARAPRAPSSSVPVAPRAPSQDEPPEDFFIDSEPPPEFADEQVPSELDASAPENNPPSPAEMAFCEFLFAHENDVTLEPLLAAHAPHALFAHPFTQRFVASWRAELAGTPDALASLRNVLVGAERAWFDRMVLGDERDGLSELEPTKILQDLLRQLWVAAVRRRQGELPAKSDPETDRLRISLSLEMRQIQRLPWSRACALMVPATLGVEGAENA